MHAGTHTPTKTLTHKRTHTCREERRAKELELKIISLVADNNQFKRERERLEEHLTSTQVRFLA